MARPARSVGSRVANKPPEIDGVLVRMPVGEGHWAEDIPPVPGRFRVTVSFGSATLADEHRDALELLGYRVVDLPAADAVGLEGVADFLVSEALMEQHPTYWRSLAAPAARAYHLALGPAAAAVRAVVRAHAVTLTTAR